MDETVTVRVRCECLGCPFRADCRHGVIHPQDNYCHGLFRVYGYRANGSNFTGYCPGCKVVQNNLNGS